MMTKEDNLPKNLRVDRAKDDLAPKNRRVEGTTTMSLYMIHRTGDIAGWDECLGFVVSAQNEAVARGLAAATAGDEGEAPWLSVELSTCVRIGTSDLAEAKVVLTSFRAG